MEAQKALHIARREWHNIRSSLQSCGDIGELAGVELVAKLNRTVDVEPANLPFPQSPIRISKSNKNSLFVRDLMGMDYKLNKLPTYGYFTPEAAHVFAALTTKAGERLGLKGALAKTFGKGYSLVRTGCLDSNGTEKQHEEQMLFFKTFFPVGGGFNWDFDSPLVKKKLKLIFDRLLASQCAREKKKAPGSDKTERIDTNREACAR